MSKSIALLIAMLSLFKFNTLAQATHTLDSLENKLNVMQSEKMKIGNNKPSKADTLMADLLFTISKYYLGNNPAKATTLTKRSLKLSKQLKYTRGISNAYGCIGVNNAMRGNFPEALKFFTTALNVSQKGNYKYGISENYNNMGNIYKIQGDYVKALKNYFASLKIDEQLGNKSGIASCYNNIGNIYKNQGNYTEALKMQAAALQLQEEIGDKHDISLSHSNIGSIYSLQGNFKEALTNYFTALEIQEEINAKNLMATSYNNIGEIYVRQGAFTKALEYQLDALQLFKEIEDKDSEGITLILIGEVYSKQKNYTNAYINLEKGLLFSKEVGNLEWTRNAYEIMQKLDSAAGNPVGALEHYKQFIIARDSLVNSENARKSMAMQMQYDFDKKEAQLKADQEKKNLIAKKEMQKQKIIRNTFIVGSMVFLLFGLYFFRNLKKSRSNNSIISKQRKEAVKQKLELEEKQKEILDSIRYAKRIQLSLLPNQKYIQKSLVRLNNG